MRVCGLKTAANLSLTRWRRLQPVALKYIQTDRHRRKRPEPQSSGSGSSAAGLPSSRRACQRAATADAPTAPLPSPTSRLNHGVRVQRQVIIPLPSAAAKSSWSDDPDHAPPYFERHRIRFTASLRPSKRSDTTPNRDPSPSASCVMSLEPIEATKIPRNLAADGIRTS